MIENMSLQLNGYKKAKRPHHQPPAQGHGKKLLSDGFGIALQPTAKTCTLGMLTSMETDPIAWSSFANNIVIIHGGLYK